MFLIGKSLFSHWVLGTKLLLCWAFHHRNSQVAMLTYLQLVEKKRVCVKAHSYQPPQLGNGTHYLVTCPHLDARRLFLNLPITLTYQKVRENVRKQKLSYMMLAMQISTKLWKADS